ncbi:hypothetical protein [Microcella sp.]|uniref:hypothetical protein n=1 Tax=Microcella sp. TaxID=1913979 RepID=UPI00391A5792
MTHPTPERPPLLPTPVVVVWFAALVSWASGRALGALGAFQIPDPYAAPGDGATTIPDERLLALAQQVAALQSLPTTLAIVLGAIGLGMLYNRRGFDRLTRTPAVSAVVMAIASAIAAVGVLALLTIGPERPIGIVDVQVGAVVAITTAAASASAVVLIRPYVDPMVAHVWAGIAGAGLALPFMIAGISPALVMAGAIGLGIVDRVRGARIEREVEFRKQLEAAYAAEHGDGGRGIGVSGLPGMPPLPRAPRPQRPWSEGERRLSIWLGVVAVIVVALAWTAGSAAAEAGLLVAGQGFAVASLGAVPLLVQVAVLARVATSLREALAVASGLLLAASVAMTTAPVPVVVTSAIALQSLAIAIITGLVARQAAGLRLGPLVMLSITAVIVWWLVVLPSGALVLAFVAVATTILALRRKARS